MQTEQWFTELAKSEVFDASPSAYLILDRDLHIRAVNAAYEKATQQPAGALVGEYVFDAFPDNPATPEAKSSENLTRSLRCVLRLGVPDVMAIQRYDVPAPAKDGTFVEKVWKPVNSPLRDADGDVTAVLHHVEEVSVPADGSPLDVEATPSDPRVEVIDGLLSALADAESGAAQLRDSNDNLRVALQSSREIGIALGIIAFSQKVTAEAAFEMVREVSRRTNRRVRDLALDIIEQGCIGA